MTENEKRKLAIARELQELAAVTRNFAAIAKQAADETIALNNCFARLNKLAQDAEIDRLIDEADYQAARGQYAYLRPYREELRAAARLAEEAREVSATEYGPSNAQRESTCRKFLRLIK